MTDRILKLIHVGIKAHNVSSIGVRIGVPLNSAYTGSKFALVGFSESMKYELEGFGISALWQSFIDLKY
jgi:short-subunit dehydrogenase